MIGIIANRIQEGHGMAEKNLAEHLNGNEAIAKAIGLVNNEASDQNYRQLLEIIQNQIAEKRCFLIPVEYHTANDGGTVTDFRAVQYENKRYLAAFTSLNELQKGASTDYIVYDIRMFLDMVSEIEDVDGAVLNPWGESYVLYPEAVRILRNNSLLHDAIRYASEKHEGQYRKGTVMPYIVHPLETMQILNSMGADIPLQIAGVLHDTLEDTSATADELELLFGEEICRLVCMHSEDKSKSWERRKQTAIAELSQADKAFQMLVMADKVSNLRSMLRDYMAEGEALWERFQRPKEKQSWYYSHIQDALWDMQNDSNTAPVYWEMVGLYKDIFVQYYLNDTATAIYQVSADGESYLLQKGDTNWYPYEGAVPDHATQIARYAAERLEDTWAGEVNK